MFSLIFDIPKGESWCNFRINLDMLTCRGGLKRRFQVVPMFVDCNQIATSVVVSLRGGRGIVGVGWVLLKNSSLTG